MNVTHSLSSDQYLVTHSVGLSQNGIRLDHFLKDRYRKRSREQLKRAIDAGAVSIQRAPASHMQVGRLKPSSHLFAGDEVLVLTEKKVEPEVNFNYQVIFEDDSLLVMNKPPQLPVHPAGRYFFNTLLVHLKTQGHKKPLRAEADYFLVHRIDKETSGVLVLAKNKECCAALTQQFAARTTEKKYLALVRGICPEEFLVELALKRDPKSIIRLKMAPFPESEGGLPASTRFRRVRVIGPYSLVECFPKTGRQHQIRVHLDATGYPIVGDKLYGLPETEAMRFYDRIHLTAEAEAKLLLPRHALHAAWIRFFHPISREPLEFSAPFPKDLEDFILSCDTLPTTTPSESSLKT